MRPKVILAFAVLAVSVAGIANGAVDPIKARQTLMRSNGPGLKSVFQMLQGDAPFDPAAAEKAMQKLADDAAVLPTLFPPGSDVGSNARPLIWSEFDQFTALYAKLQSDAQAGAAAAAANDLESLRVAFAGVDQDCGACHEKYRMPRQ
jgi:cytochrome c556